MRKLFIFLMSVSIILTTFIPTQFVQATPTNDSQVQLNEVSNNLKELDEQIVTLNKEISNLQAKIDNNNLILNNIQLEIEQNQRDIDSLSVQIKNSEDMLSKRLKEMYKTDSYKGINYIEFLFESRSISEFFNRVEVCNVVINQDNKLIQNLKDNIEQVNKEKKQIEEKKEQQVKINEENKQQLSDVKAKQSSVADTRAKLQAEKDRLISSITANEQKLISNPIAIIDNPSSSGDQLASSVRTLKNLIPQLSVQSVIDAANAAISKGQSRIDSMGVSYSNSYEGAPTKGQIKQTLTLEATAYTADTITATGTKPVRIPGGLSTVAVDPSVIPLGSTVYVEGYGYAIAADTGGLIKGNRIDLFMNSESECSSFGRKNVIVYVLG